MLYGIRAKEQRRLARSGYRVQTLIAYGAAWYRVVHAPPGRAARERPVRAAAAAARLIGVATARGMASRLDTRGVLWSSGGARVSLRPDLVTPDVPLRDGAPRDPADPPRAGRILPGLWQCVTGGVEPGERVAAGGPARGGRGDRLRPGVVEAFFDLDLVNQFYETAATRSSSSAVFAVRVRPDADPRSPTSTTGRAGWSRRPPARSSGPPTRSVRRVRDLLLDPARALVPARRGGPASRRV